MRRKVVALRNGVKNDRVGIGICNAAAWESQVRLLPASDDVLRFGESHAMSSEASSRGL
jgi:hypothetical protein